MCQKQSTQPLKSRLSRSASIAITKPFHKPYVTLTLLSLALFFQIGDAAAVGDATFNVTASVGVTVNSVVSAPPFKSTDGNISCGTNCTHDYANGSNVSMFANVSAGYEFQGWTGDCISETTEVCTLSSVSGGTTYSISAIAWPEVDLELEGRGTVTSDLGSINCFNLDADPDPDSGSVCRQGFENGFVFLTATREGGWQAPNNFGGWSGCDFVSVDGKCRVDITSPKSVIATFTPHQETVRIAGGSPNGGTITSSNGAIDCGVTCQADFDHDSNVKLIPTPDTGYDFGAWGGACAGQSGVCNLVVDDDTTNPTLIDVTATFTLQSRSLTVTKPAGAPLVRDNLSPPYEIECGADCQGDFLYGTMPTLYALLSDPSWRLNDWTGCTTNPVPNQCKVLMDANKTVSANYTRLYELTVSATGKTGGTISTTPGSDISFTTASNGLASEDDYFDTGTSVTVNVTPPADFTYEFGGDCSGTSCTVVMTSDQSVSVLFTPILHTLSVAKSHAAAPAVTELTINRINCGVDCTEEIAQGESLVLEAGILDDNWRFIGWSGCNSVSGSLGYQCNITVTTATTVTANYVPRYKLTVNSSTVFHAGSVITTTPSSSINRSTSTGGPVTDDAYFDENAVVVVNVDSNAAYAATFSGDCSASICSVTMSETRTVEISHALAQFTLAVTLQGTGSGSVSSHIGNIDCPSTCSDDYAYQFGGSYVDLTGVADAGSVITGWSNVMCEAGSQLPDTCRVRVTQAKTAIVDFAPAFDLTVTPTGEGLGIVTDTNFFVGSDDHINCGSNCTVSYPANSQVTLNAQAQQFQTFVGWTGAGCFGLNPCTVTLNTAKTVEARFEQLRAVNLDIEGSGRIVADTAGALDNLTQCDDSCGTSYPIDTTVQFEAVAVTGNVLVGWEGDCAFAGTNPICSLTLSEAGPRNILAKFDIDGPTMEINLFAGVQIRIVSSPAGIDCLGECIKNFPLNSSVLLTAITDPNVVIEAWGFAECPDPISTCSVTMNSDRSANITWDSDADNDGIGDNLDNCLNLPNADQADANDDGEGDVCDTNSDTDQDTVFDSDDNCPLHRNPLQQDNNGFEDGEGAGDICETNQDETLCFPIKTSTSVTVICL